MPQRWEYKIIHFRTDQFTPTGLSPEINQRFDEYGAEGWELVRTESILSPTGILFRCSFTSGMIAFFKRPLE